MNFFELTDVKQWQKLQDHFAEVLHVTIRTIDPDGELLTVPSRPTNLCQEILGGSIKAIQKCAECMPDTRKGEEYWIKNPTYKCSLGFEHFVIPIRPTEANVVAYVLGGPVVVGKIEDLQKYKQLANELDVDPEELIAAVKQIRTFTYWGLHAAVELLRDVTNCLVQLGYQKHRLKAIIPDLYKEGKPGKNIYDRFYMHEMLELIMDLASKVTKTECASMMMLDEQKDELTIRAARGLSYDIIKSTHLKLGEGIAGRVAKDRKPILITENTTDNYLKKNMKRPELRKALIAPIYLNDEVLGVINLSTKQPASELSEESFGMLEQITKLASCAIDNLRYAADR